MHAQREVIDESSLSAQIEDTDFGVWDTSTETRLRVRLIFAIAITRMRQKPVSQREVFGGVKENVIRFLEKARHYSASSSP